jgi:hypothetical protein
MSPVEIRTQPLFVLTAHLAAPQLDEDTPRGRRKIVPVLGGTFEGERLRGTIEGAGGHDWALIRSDGTLELDVRLVLRTDDDALILMTYYGIRSGPPDVLARLARKEPVDPSEYYFRIAPRFETGASRYAWLNNIICVGYGERIDVGPRYTVFEVL